MVLSLLMQTKLVVFSILAGFITGFIFDFYRVFRGFENIHKVFIIIEDILFWILTSIIIFIFLLYTNQAVISLYVYLWIAFGILLYLKIISRSFTRIQYQIVCWIAKFLRIVVNILIYPFKLIVYSLSSKNKQKFKRNDLNKT